MILAVILSKILCFVFKKIKFSNKLILAWLLVLIAYTLSEGLFYGILFMFGGFEDKKHFYWVLAYFLPEFMFIIVSTLNLNIWVRYFLKIGEMARIVRNAKKLSPKIIDKPTLFLIVSLCTSNSIIIYI